MKEDLIRKCNTTCEFYDPKFKKCAIYYLVNEQKRKMIYSTVTEDSPCRFRLGGEVDTAIITKSRLLEIINRFPDGFREKVTLDDINPGNLQLSW